MEQTGHPARWCLWILVPASKTTDAFSMREPLSETHNCYCNHSAIRLKWSLPCCPFHVLKESDHISVCVVLFEHAFGGLVQMLDTFLFVSELQWASSRS